MNVFYNKIYCNIIIHDYYILKHKLHPSTNITIFRVSLFQTLEVCLRILNKRTHFKY